MNDSEKLRGLNTLVTDTVINASKLIERVQKETADRPFKILQEIPVIAPFAETIHALHNLGVTTTHETIRWVTEVVGRTVEATINSR